MTPLLFTALAVSGGLGAVARFVLDGLLRAHVRSRLPWATILINVTGSFALGLVTGLAAGGLLPEPWLLILGVGFLGGYTTFSTASLETVRLLQHRHWTAAALNGLGALVIAVGAAGLGLALGVSL